MSRTHMPGELGMVGKRVLLRLLAAGRDGRVTPTARDLQPRDGESLITAHDDHDALDAVAGCEYVDDRIRLRE